MSDSKEDRIRVHLGYEPLDIHAAIQSVTAPGCGAISSFIGTTRDEFEGKKVIELSYEAYDSMAIAELKRVGERAMKKWPGIDQIVILHRLGTVKVCEASVVIAVSAPHRSDALEACAFAIDDLKATVPIWKREIYEDGSIWKQNAEHCCGKVPLLFANPSDAHSHHT
uniref:Molybdopterin synthase catalytic subunit n=1 Tax=Timspurckia oligopyrenoides TaxID=708627 RepID=A0A7S0ZGM8_9RHOD|mmetsp:Transcript_4515/g.7907  ORF Transcript_4515/g.7907 Transcript_4515/m.7907 type:complete len:168 (+) Transcript_4515:368-871(+)|eukprot:CAMPEP_0182450116 /NCGR_PEP_ID=MMETSP1172-20130603/39042_1 /TAXON_ID=708627 /ORGANISM="Timspurckia oligopyrenoides, Strain CCMP3278" /LENGTH=167 /DNA_ID=CAMNT_0024647619 /DNA_START=342 /DNA_END=845 /DNA_ORIENTATION=-